MKKALRYDVSTKFMVNLWKRGGGIGDTDIWVGTLQIIYCGRRIKSCVGKQMKKGKFLIE